MHQQQNTFVWLYWKTEQKHHGFKEPWDTTKSDIIFILTFFSTFKESKAILSTEWWDKKNCSLWDRVILLFECLSIIFILKKALPILCPYIPCTCFTDGSFKQQISILMQAYARNHVQPSLATWKLQQTVCRQLNCHFNFVSVSEPWLSNSDRAATNQTVNVCLLQEKLGYVVRPAASLALSSQEWFRETVDDIVHIKVALGVYSHI